MGHVAVLGVFVADLAFRADRMPVMGETLMGRSFAMNPGGKGSNQAVAAARMGADVAMITRLGQDDFAQMAFALWQEAGITPHVTQDPASYTGAAQFADRAGCGCDHDPEPGPRRRIATRDAGFVRLRYPERDRNTQPVRGGGHGCAQRANGM